MELDTKIKTQKERVEYVENNINLDECNNFELEFVSNYILNGEDNNKKNYKTNDRLKKQLKKEKYQGLNNSNLLDDYERKVENDKSIYKTKKQTINKKDIEELKVVEEYNEFYSNIDSLIDKNKNKKNKEYYKLCKLKYSVKDDMILSKDQLRGTFGYSVDSYMGQNNHELSEVSYDIQYIDNMLSNYIYLNQNLKPDSDRYLDFLQFKIALYKTYNEITDREKTIIQCLILNLSQDAMASASHTSKRDINKWKKIIFKKILKKY